MSIVTTKKVQAKRKAKKQVKSIEEVIASAVLDDGDAIDDFVNQTVDELNGGYGKVGTAYQTALTKAVRDAVNARK